MDCVHFCCECCCCYNNEQCTWYRKRRQTRDKHPCVEYYQPSKAIDVSDTPEAPYRSVPIGKVFDFPQSCHEFQQHPQVGTPDFTSPVTQQPRSGDSDWESMYISSRGRTIGTVSEIPQLYVSRSFTPDVPPFSPPAEDPPIGIMTQCVRYVGQDPAIQFSVYYDIQRRVLTLHVLCAYNLHSKEIFGSTDFFMSLFIMPSRDKIHQTKVSVGTNNPMFNQTFDFSNIGSEDLLEQVMVFQIFSQDKFARDHLVGTTIVPLSEVDLLGMNIIKRVGEGRELLKRFRTGDLLLSLSYSPHSEVFQGIILKATNLPRPHKWSLADPYVKVYLLHKQTRVSKWKSATKKSTLTPIFNEAFEFKTTDMDPKDISIEMFVMDRDRFLRNNVLGMVYIGPDAPSELGVAHYNEALAHPQYPISHWHKLIPHHPIKSRKRHKSVTM